MALCTDCGAQAYYTVVGDTDTFTFPFQYREMEDVNVALYDSATGKYVDLDRSKWTFENLTTIKLATPPGVDIVIYRCTDTTQPAATFYPGNSIKAEDLNANQEQVLNAIEELRCAIASISDGDNNGGDTGDIGQPCDNGSCNASLICFEGVCLQPCDAGPCPTGYECVSGLCLPNCIQDVCPGLFDCVDGICLPPPDEEGNCADGYTNVGGVCLPNCTTNGDCPNGFDCGGDGKCYPVCDEVSGCPDGFACEDGVCKPVFTDDAPSDGLLYGRKFTGWERAIPRDFSTLPQLPVVSSVQPTAIVTDAPVDNFTYGRVDAAWQPAAIYPDTLLGLPGGLDTGCVDGFGANESTGALFIAWSDPTSPTGGIAGFIGGLLNKVNVGDDLTAPSNWAVDAEALYLGEDTFNNNLRDNNWYPECSLQMIDDPSTRFKARFRQAPELVNGVYTFFFTDDTDPTPLINGDLGDGLVILFLDDPDVYPYEIVDQAQWSVDDTGTGWISYTEGTPEIATITFNEYSLNGQWVQPNLYPDGAPQSRSFWVSSDNLNWYEGTMTTYGYGSKPDGNVDYESRTWTITTQDSSIIRALGNGYCNPETCDDFIWDCYPTSIQLCAGGCYDARATTHGCSRDCIGGNEKGDLAYKWEEKIDGNWVVFQDWQRNVTHTFYTDGLEVGDTRTIRVTARCQNFGDGVTIVGEEIIVSVIDCSLLPDSVIGPPSGTLPYVPDDGLMYGRKNGEWNKVLQYNIDNYPTLPS